MVSKYTQLTREAQMQKGASETTNQQRLLVIDFMQECFQTFVGSFLHTLFKQHMATLVATACAPDTSQHCPCRACATYWPSNLGACQALNDPPVPAVQTAPGAC